VTARVFEFSGFSQCFHYHALVRHPAIVAAAFFLWVEVCLTVDGESDFIVLSSVLLVPVRFAAWSNG